MVMPTCISVIIPVYNKAELTAQCVGLNISHANTQCEWVLIDNNSDAPTKAMLLQLKAQAEAKGHLVQIVTETTNTGVARAWNKGISVATGTHYCILNNDCVMQPDWDAGLLEEVELGKLKLFSPQVLEPHNFKEPYTLEMFLDHDHWRFMAERNKYRYQKGFFSGVVIFGTKEVFTTIGPFDEVFWLSLEDMDFEYRAHLKQLPIGICGSVSAFHFVSATRKEVPMSEVKNREHFKMKWNWDFIENENTFPNKLNRKYSKWLLKNRGLLSKVKIQVPK
jgi:GT2 family glycosyltransferase